MQIYEFIRRGKAQNYETGLGCILKEHIFRLY
jgi:hypothetical protein